MTSIYLCMFFLIVQQKIFISAVEFTVNPGCNLTACQDPGAFAMFYGRKDFDKSSVHILYSSMEELTIGAIETPTNQQPQIDYEKLFSKNYTGAISFPNSPPITALALTVRRLIEFNDVDDTGNMKDDDNTSISYTFNDTQTINVTFPSASTDQPTFLISIPEINGTLTISIVYPGELLRDSQFPKLQVTNKGFFINIALEATGFHWPRTRFALEFYIFTFARESPQIIESKYIDDQYTPGIFKVFQLKSTSSMYTASMLWKPVVYLSQDRSIEANTLMQFYSLKTNVELDPKFDRGIANALFNKTYVSAFNVSLGQSNDGFYTKNNYTFLQFTASLDESQLDSTTTFVSIALIVSLALPIIVGTIAVIFIVKRRCTSPQPTAYDSIAE